jgi:hypothetical protein
LPKQRSLIIQEVGGKKQGLQEARNEGVRSKIQGTGCKEKKQKTEKREKTRAERISTQLFKKIVY